DGDSMIAGSGSQVLPILEEVWENRRILQATQRGNGGRLQHCGWRWGAHKQKPVAEIRVLVGTDPQQANRFRADRFAPHSVNHGIKRGSIEWLQLSLRVHQDQRTVRAV